jgi:tetratricopeptide (TPR) repeat protein
MLRKLIDDGNTQCFINKYKSAEKYYLDGLQLDPDNLEILMNLGKIYYDNKTKYSNEYYAFYKSEEYYLRALKVSPNNEEILYNLVDLFYFKIRDNKEKFDKYLEMIQKIKINDLARLETLINIANSIYLKDLEKRYSLEYLYKNDSIKKKMFNNVYKRESNLVINDILKYRKEIISIRKKYIEILNHEIYNPEGIIINDIKKHFESF